MTKPSGSVTLNVVAGKGLNVLTNSVEVNYGATSNVIVDAPNLNSIEGKDFFLFADFSNNNEVNYTDLSILSNFVIGNIGTLTNLTISSTLNVRGALDLADNDILEKLEIPKETINYIKNKIQEKLYVSNIDI